MFDLKGRKKLKMMSRKKWFCFYLHADFDEHSQFFFPVILGGNLWVISLHDSLQKRI